MSPDLQAKFDSLRSGLRRLGRLAIAYSGGVDSTFLLRVASETLGPENVLAITAASPVTPASEMRRAQEMAAQMGVTHLVVQSGEFADAGFRSNPPDRCYICKRIRFEQLIALARERGFEHLADGTNVDDMGDYRPGLKAAEELGVLSPLRDAGMGKAEIRAASRLLGLPTADLPSFACLASRVPYGTPLTETVLARIERGEEMLSQLGLHQYRLRDHGDMARIEVPPEDFALLLAQRESLVQQLKQLGYHYVTLDLAGYRTGSMNETLA